jgi:hypothetical protein
MLVDPTLSGAAFRVRDDSRLDAFEACDPSAAYEDGYERGGRIVANFVFPAWFGADAPGGRLDERGLIRQPGQVLPGGHCLVVSSSELLWRVLGGGTPEDLNEPGTRVLRRLASLRPHITHIDLVWSP